jgi:hypothetical protein
MDGTLAYFRMICFIACMVCGLAALDGSHLHGEAVHIAVRTFTGGGYLLCLMMMHRSLYFSRAFDLSIRLSKNWVAMIESVDRL